MSLYPNLDAYRRSTRGHHGPPPLPTTALEYYHAEIGVSGSSWTGQIAGTVMPFVGPVTYAAEGPDLFRNRLVVQCHAGSASLYNPAAPMFLAGTRPWTFQIFRLRGFGTTWGLSDFGSPSVDAHMMALGATDNDQIGGFVNGASVTPNVLSSLALDDGVHSAQLWSVGADANIQVDDTLTTAVGAGGALLADTVAIGIGQTASGPFWLSDTSHAFLLCCSALPTPVERNALRAWARDYWGCP